MSCLPAAVAVSAVGSQVGGPKRYGCPLGLPTGTAGSSDMAAPRGIAVSSGTPESGTRPNGREMGAGQDE